MPSRTRVRVGGRLRPQARLPSRTGGPASVSYTHLDVYKRQERTSTAANAAMESTERHTVENPPKSRRSSFWKAANQYLSLIHISLPRALPSFLKASLRTT